MLKPIGSESLQLNRRDFINTSAAALAALACGEPAAALSAGKRPEARADTIILLWMAGGMAQTETFDPKKYTPFESGLESAQVLSTFPSIDTVVDNIKLSQGLEKVSQVMDRATLIRSHRVGSLGAILHSRHQYHWHTGYAPPLSVAAPHMGSVVARTLGPVSPDVPAFVDIGQNMEIGAESDSLKAFHTAGFLGTEYGPFMVSDPREAAAAVRPPEGLASQRFRRRYSYYKKLVEKSPVLKHGSSYQKESLFRYLDRAHRLLDSPAAKAFDLDLEPRESYQVYNTGRFGLGCLLARRLAEVGVRFIEVTSEYVPFRYWDTHENGHQRTAGLKTMIDAPIARLLIFGGGFKKGFLYGKTADERPCRIVDNPIGIEDLHATLYSALGIPPDLSYVVEKRPFFATKDGRGKPVSELFA